MSGRAVPSWVEKIERILEMKPSAQTHVHHWLYRIISVCLLVAIFSGFSSAILAESPALTLSWFAQTLLNITIFSAYFGQGLHEESFGRFGDGFCQTGRKLRVISIVSLFTVFPFYCAVVTGFFADFGGHKYVRSFGRRFCRTGAGAVLRALHRLPLSQESEKHIEVRCSEQTRPTIAHRIAAAEHGRIYTTLCRMWRTGAAAPDQTYPNTGGKTIATLAAHTA